MKSIVNLRLIFSILRPFLCIWLEFFAKLWQISCLEKDSILKIVLFTLLLLSKFTFAAENLPVIDIGFRLQSALEHQVLENEQNQKKNTFNDFYLRRLRLEVASEFKKDFFFYMDIRNDGVSQDDDGNGEFTVGDAYVRYQLSKNHYVKLHRAKVDVSRTQTVSSAKLLFHDRARVADFAAHFVSHGRRASNIQFNGLLGDKIHYHLVLGEGVQGTDFLDAKEASASKIIKQDFLAGVKIKYFPLKGWIEDKVQETYFGQKKHLTLGVGYFQTNNISFEANSKTDELDRSLSNVELSMHYHGVSLSAEYFYLKGLIEDYNAANFKSGSANGHYVQGEVFLNKSYTSSLVYRYESYYQFKHQKDYLFTSKIIGTNYYFEHNKIRTGFFAEFNEYGNSIRSLINNQSRELALKWTTQLHF